MMGTSLQKLQQLVGLRIKSIHVEGETGKVYLELRLDTGQILRANEWESLEFGCFPPESEANTDDFNPPPVERRQRPR